MAAAAEAGVSASAAAVELGDLARFHAPVSDFLELSGDAWPLTEEAIAKYSLSAEQLVAYERDGFLGNVRVLNERQVERLRADLAEIMDPAHPKHRLWHEYNENEAPKESGMALFHSLGAWRIAASFHDVLFHPAYLVPAMQLMGKERVRLWHDQIFSKPPRNGSIVAWHQDFSYWTRVSPMNHLTVHVALDDQCEENGAINYVPGSHRWPLLPVTSRHFGDMDSVRTVLTPDQVAEFDRRVGLELKAGEAAFHHPLSVHGSYGNRSDRPRRATVINLFGDGTVSATDDGPLLEGLPHLARGVPLRGTFFPLLTGHTAEDDALDRAWEAEHARPDSA